MERDSREDWARFDAESIPTKSDLSLLERWLESLPDRAGRKLLDLGCGAGAVSRRLGGRGYDVVGVDINAEAVETARRGGRGTFHRRDVASPGGLGLDEAPFDVVVCQLVISVVGRPDDRKRLLNNAYDALRPGGRLYLSASGVSSAINPGYQRLYQEDFERTGELHTYESRDAGGKVLYRTHHFTEEELSDLLVGAGFEEVDVVSKVETSSRRPDEAAVFLYAFGERPR